jgi:two-component system, NarL family, nitrate/nitrite response regulator NarL
VPADLPPSALTRILLVDDDPSFVEMLRTALLDHDDFDVVGTARNGQEAYDCVVELKPSVVLMDVSMPLLDGVEATRLIQDLEDPPAVVLITGEETEATDVAAYEAGAAAYLRKSEDLPMLVGVIVAVSRLATTPA